MVAAACDLDDIRERADAHRSQPGRGGAVAELPVAVEPPGPHGAVGGHGVAHVAAGGDVLVGPGAGDLHRPVAGGRGAVAEHPGVVVAPGPHRAVGQQCQRVVVPGGHHRHVAEGGDRDRAGAVAAVDPDAELSHRVAAPGDHGAVRAQRDHVLSARVHVDDVGQTLDDSRGGARRGVAAAELAEDVPAPAVRRARRRRSSGSRRRRDAEHGDDHGKKDKQDSCSGHGASHAASLAVHSEARKVGRRVNPQDWVVQRGCRSSHRLAGIGLRVA